jgi:hypothetical protein
MNRCLPAHTPINPGPRHPTEGDQPPSSGFRTPHLRWFATLFRVSDTSTPMVHHPAGGVRHPIDPGVPSSTGSAGPRRPGFRPGASSTYLLLALLLTACGTHPVLTPDPTTANLLPPPDAAPAAPTVVLHGARYWVTGLPANHGWKRNDWVALTSPPDERGVSRPLGVALVLTTQAGRADAAPLGVAGTVDNADLIGARARVIHTTEGEWPHVGKLLATVLIGRPAPTRVRLNVGKNDGVFKGDRYSLRRLEDNNVVPRSRVEVVEVGPTWSVAQPGPSPCAPPSRSAHAIFFRAHHGDIGPCPPVDQVEDAGGPVERPLGV